MKKLEFAMVIMKFGGTSVGTAKRMRGIVPLLHDASPMIVVLSAMSGTTNALFDIANAIQRAEFDTARHGITALETQYRIVVDHLFDLDEFKRVGEGIVTFYFNELRDFTHVPFTANTANEIVSLGEIVSSTLFFTYLKERGRSAVLLPALNFMRLDETGEPAMDITETLLKRELNKHSGHTTFVTQGYICRNASGEIDNLKRGGSDYTATIIGASLDACEIQIWTDIDGMHNNDPRFVKPTRPIAELTFDEAAELAYFGAKILHPTCVLPAQRKNIPVRLLNTMQAERPGTLIHSSALREGIKAVAAKSGITALRIRSSRMLLAYGFLRAVFEVFERYKTPIDAITTSEVAVSLTVDDDSRLVEIIGELEKLGSVEVSSNLALVCVVGDFGSDRSGCAVKVFQALRDIPVRMISYGGSECNITIVVTEELKQLTLLALNEPLFGLAY